MIFNYYKITCIKKLKYFLLFFYLLKIKTKTKMPSKYDTRQAEQLKNALAERKKILKEQANLNLKMCQEELFDEVTGERDRMRAAQNLLNTKRAAFLKRLLVLNREIIVMQNFSRINIALFKKLPKYMVLNVAKFMPVSQPNLSGYFPESRYLLGATPRK